MENENVDFNDELKRRTACVSYRKLNKLNLVSNPEVDTEAGKCLHSEAEDGQRKLVGWFNVLQHSTITAI